MRLALAVLTFCSICFAQDFELWGSGGYSALGGNPMGFAGYGLNNALEDPVTLDNGPSAAFRGTLNTGRWFGHELGASYTAHTVTYNHQMSFSGVSDYLVVPGRRSTWYAFYNLLVYLGPEDSRVRPFLAAGPHLASFKIRAGESLMVLGQQDFTKFGGNYGGGLKIKVHRNFAIRMDFREYLTPKPFDLLGKSGLLHHREVSAGFGLVM